MSTMSDSMSSTSSEPRMLERRVSNQRAELSNDQQMNYLLAWFTKWSDLQKEDFVPVLAEKLSSKWAAVNGVNETLSHLNLNKSERPPSLFECQLKLFKDWVGAWSDDQKSYFILRLKDIDSQFSEKYEHYLEFGKASPVKDFFEPGVPVELDLSIHKDESTKPPEFNPLKNLLKDKITEEGKENCEAGDESGSLTENVDLEKYQTDDDLCKPPGPLSTIDEDFGQVEVEEE